MDFSAFRGKQASKPFSHLDCEFDMLIHLAISSAALTATIVCHGFFLMDSCVYACVSMCVCVCGWVMECSRQRQRQRQRQSQCKAFCRFQRRVAGQSFSWLCFCSLLLVRCHPLRQHEAIRARGTVRAKKQWECFAVLCVCALGAAILNDSTQFTNDQKSRVSRRNGQTGNTDLVVMAQNQTARHSEERKDGP